MGNSLTTYEDYDFYTLYVLLRQTTYALLRSREKEVNQYGVTTTQAAAMFVIHALGNKATPTEISRWMFREPHSTSNLLSRMEKLGLITKTNDLDRKNLVRVTLTEKGRKIYKESLKRESVRRIMCSFSAKERQQLGALLKILWFKAFEDIDVDRRPPFPPIPVSSEIRTA